MTTFVSRFTRFGLVALATAVGFFGLAAGSVAVQAGGAREASSIRGPAWVSSNLNLREGPSIESDIVMVLPKDTRILIRGAARHGFYPVTYVAPNGDRVLGFAHGDSVARWAVTTADLNLRSGPGVSYDIRTVIPEGTRVVVVGLPRNGFYPVTYPLPENGFLQGWSSKEYLRWGVGAPLESGG